MDDAPDKQRSKFATSEAQHAESSQNESSQKDSTSSESESDSKDSETERSLPDNEPLPPRMASDLPQKTVEAMLDEDTTEVCSHSNKRNVTMWEVPVQCTLLGQQVCSREIGHDGLVICFRFGDSESPQKF